MSEREYQASNVTPPLKNTSAMRCIAVLLVGPTVTTVDLDTLFGKLDNSNYLTLRADGAKCYVAFGSSAGHSNRWTRRRDGHRDRSGALQRAARENSDGS
jgi:hypothetical protein